MRNESLNHNLNAVDTAELCMVEGGGLAMGILVGAAIYQVAADQYDRRTESLASAIRGVDFTD